DDKLDIPETLLIEHEDITYRLFISDDADKCYSCKRYGHTAQQCQKGIFVGYCENTKGYRIWYPKKNKIEVSRDIISMENSRFRIDEEYKSKSTQNVAAMDFDLSKNEEFESKQEDNQNNNEEITEITHVIEQGKDRSPYNL
ncbi:hypothetical protein CBL_21523, partial [Carabus blaptoides fortunei]